MENAFQRHLSLIVGNASVQDGEGLRTTLGGGKKIRGSLLLLINESLGGSFDLALPRAVAVELIQAATLMHDDFVDQDRVRRGMPAVWTLEGARRAVLLGDAMFASALEMMNDLSREDGCVLSHAIVQLSGGALKEPLDPVFLLRELEKRPIDCGLYERIIHLKTGILFGAACRLGAMAARADTGLRDQADRYGTRIGEAYQIADDLKEVKKSLNAHSMDARKAAELAPALLHFASDIKPHMPALLRDAPCLDEVEKYLACTAERMEREIELRLRSALAYAGSGFSDGCLGELIRGAPWELIELFNET